MRIASQWPRALVVPVVQHPTPAQPFLACTNYDGALAPTPRRRIDKDGTFVAGSDFAGALPAAGAPAAFQPGDVLVLGPTRPRRVEHAARPHDPRVAGVYSTRPAVLGAEKPGGLTRPGHAMKAGPAPPPGTILGKALDPLPGGTGLIRVLVMPR